MLGDVLVVDEERIEFTAFQTALGLTELLEEGTKFVIVRKGPLCLFRYDASMWEIRSIDGHCYPWMLKLGFGFTRRGAIRDMHRDKLVAGEGASDAA